MKTQLISMLGAALLVLGAAGCRRDPNKPAEGPMQRAGEKVDSAAGKTKEVAKDAKDETKDAAKDVKRDLKK